MQCYIPANELCQQKCSENSYGFGHKENHHGHQYGSHGISGQTQQYGQTHGQTPQYGQTHSYNQNYTMPKPQAQCYSQTQESYYLETNTARPDKPYGQAYGQAYGQGQHIDHGLANGQSPYSVTQTHGYPSGHAQNGSHHQASYGVACHVRTRKHKKAANKCKNGYRSGTGSGSGSDSGSDCDSD